MKFCPPEIRSLVCFLRGWCALLLLLGIPSLGQAVTGSLLEVEKGSHIVILGNGLGEGMMQHGYFEMALHCAYPDDKLVVRNMAFSGDEIGRMDRDPGFGNLDDHLGNSLADILICFFGFNESFRESAGLEDFQQSLRTFIQDRNRQFYNGRSVAQLVFVSPVPYEQLSEGMPAEEPINSNLTLYTNAMRDVCLEEAVVFFDVFSPLKAVMEATERPLTDNGIHLNNYGHWLLSKVLAVKLGLVPTGSGRNFKGGEALQGLVWEKNQHWLNRWRPLNGQHVYGVRREPYGVVTFPSDMEELSRIIARADQEIWRARKPDIQAIWQEEPSLEAGYYPSSTSISVEPPSPINAKAYLRPEDSLRSFRTGPGLEVSLWASEEDLPLHNPMTMRFDSKGRLWVACAPSYPHPFPGKLPDDYLLILEDQDMDHRVDRHQVFARGMNMPSGMVLTPDGALVGEQRALVRYRDLDGDGSADTRSEILGGFGVGDVQHAIRGLGWEPTGDLWFCQGNYAYSRVETAKGPLHVNGAAMMRWRAREADLEFTPLESLSQPQGRALGQWGQAYLSDADGGAVFDRAFLSGAAAGGDFNLAGIGHPAVWGGEILYSEHFPRSLRGVFLRNQVDSYQGIRGHEWRPNGASQELRQLPDRFLKSTDASFRPVAMEVGPDGALYVLDHYNPVIGMDTSTVHDPRRAHSHGRIWRVSALGKRPFWRLPTHGVPTLELLEGFREVDPAARAQVRWELWQRDPQEVLATIEEWLGILGHEDYDEDYEDFDYNDSEERPQILTEIAWLRQAYGMADGPLLAELTKSSQPGARVASARILGDWGPDLEEGLELLARLMEDEDPRVRLEALNAAVRFGTPEAGDIARLARHYPMDPKLRFIYERTTEGLGTLNGAPPGERAKALAKSSAELIEGEMTPHAASVLFGRDNVDPGGLVRAATILARRQNESLTAFLLDAMADQSTQDSQLRNVIALLPKADPWELHYASPRLHELARRQPRDLVRNAAYAGLLIAAAESDTFDALIDQVRKNGSYEYAAMLEGGVYALASDGAKRGLRRLVEDELARDPVEAGNLARFVQVIAPRSRELKFVELEVFAKGGNVALGKEASQLKHPDGVAWWSQNAKAGVNGIILYDQEEKQEGPEGEESIRGVAVSGPSSAELDLWWGVDLGGELGHPVEKLVLHPGPEGFDTPWLRFELRGLLGELIWWDERATMGTEPISVEVDSAIESRRNAAKRIAGLLGDEFRTNLVERAKGSETLERRFGAMRALAAMGVSPEGLKICKYQFWAGSSAGPKLPKVYVQPKQPVELLLHNRNGHARSLGVIEGKVTREASNSGTKVTPIADAPQAEPEPSFKVLHHSEAVEAGNTTILRFFAPDKAGEYPLYSGHGDNWTQQQGILVVAD